MFIVPSTPEQWLKVSEEFKTLWNYPNCIGSIDGKHIELQLSMNSGSEFYNYNGFFSIVLFALVDANYNFLFVDTGCQGRISDDGVFRNTTLFKKLKDGSINIPEPKPLPNRNKNVPFVIVGDEAFTLSENVMKPYSGLTPKDLQKEIITIVTLKYEELSRTCLGSKHQFLGF